MAHMQSIKLFDLLKRRFKRRASDESGSVLIEFGLLALPFFALMGAILETAIMLLASQILDAGLDDASRFVRTGQAQAGGYSSAEFKTKVCESLYGLFDCDELRIFVSPIATFSSANFGLNVVDLDDGTWTSAESYNHGSGSEVVLARAYYKWPTFLNFMNSGLASLGDDTYLLSSARLFRNEPF